MQGQLNISEAALGRNEDQRMPLGLRIQLRWWKFIKWWHFCPDCGRRGWDPRTPRWEDDRVVRTLGWVTADRCRACGKESMT